MGNGRMKYVIYYAEPKSGKPTQEPKSGKPTVGKPHSGKTRPISNKENTTNKDETNKKELAKPPKGVLQADEWQELIDAWKPVNKFYEKFYRNKTDRQAVLDILKKSNKEQYLKILKVLPETNKINYFPNITSPIHLRDKWASLEDAFVRYKNRKLDKKADTQEVDRFIPNIKKP